MIRLPDGYEIDLDKVPTVRDIIAINAQAGWIPETEDERLLQAWARSVAGLGSPSATNSARTQPPPTTAQETEDAR